MGLEMSTTSDEACKLFDAALTQVFTESNIHVRVDKIVVAGSVSLFFFLQIFGYYQVNILTISTPAPTSPLPYELYFSVVIFLFAGLHGSAGCASDW